MSDVVKDTMLSHLNNDLRDAITDVGGNLEGVDCPFDYPQVIRDQLHAGENSGTELLAGDGIELKGAEVQGKKYTVVYSNSKGNMVRQIISPTGIVIPATMSIQNAIEKVINEIIPASGGGAGMPVMEVKEAIELFDAIFGAV